MLKSISPKGNRRFNDSFKNIKQGELKVNSEQHACAEHSLSMTIKKIININT